MGTCIRTFADEQQIIRCKLNLEEGDQELQTASKLFSAVGNLSRLKILYLLKTEGRLCPCDLSDILGISVPGVSQHLKRLREEGLVQSEQEAQTIFYSLSATERPIIGLLLSLTNLKEVVS